MGQKIHPIGLRLGKSFDWQSRWFANKKEYQKILLEDIKIRRSLMEKLKSAGVTKVEIERSINKVGITIHVSRPGIAIGRGGTGLEDLKKFLTSLIHANDNGKTGAKIDLRIEPVKEPNLDAYLVAVNIAEQLAKRLSPKRVMGQAIDKVMASGAKGVRVLLSGRVGGAEIGRKEKNQAGVIPLNTIREKIDFAAVPSLTRSGYVGVKVWICRPGNK